MLTNKDLTKIDQLIRKRTQESEKRVKNAIKEDILQFKDEVLGELQDLRDDVAVVTGYRQMLEDHDQDLEKLKAAHPHFSHS